MSETFKIFNSKEEAESFECEITTIVGFSSLFGKIIGNNIKSFKKSEVRKFYLGNGKWQVIFPKV